ncbi:hypothetical protein KEM55_000574 [Ascosphaera atra]|nr:hypothetical protein KEM55_000574 [Ascosphaera atra]
MLPTRLTSPSALNFSSSLIKWYLIYARCIAHEADAAYLVADSPCGPFCIAPNGRALDDRRCKRIVFGWIGDRKPEDSEWQWGDDMAVPPSMTLPTQKSIVVKRLGGMDAKFFEHPSTLAGKGQLISSQAKPMKDTTGYGLLLHCHED